MTGRNPPQPLSGHRYIWRPDGTPRDPATQGRRSYTKIRFDATSLKRKHGSCAPPIDCKLQTRRHHNDPDPSHIAAGCAPNLGTSRGNRRSMSEQGCVKDPCIPFIHPRFITVANYISHDLITCSSFKLRPNHQICLKTVRKRCLAARMSILE